MANVSTAAGAPTRPKYGSMSRDRRWALRWSYFFLVLFAIFFLMPPVYMLITSLKTSAEISAATNPWWISSPTLQNYIDLLSQNQFLVFFRNSAIVSICVVVLTMMISVVAAFALARMKFWGSATLATGVFLTYLIPETLLFIPLFKMFAWVNETLGIQLMNHWWTMIILYPTLTVPFATWIMIGYFASIPKELDEAAQRLIAQRVGEAVMEGTGLPVDEVVVVPPSTIPKTSSGKRQRHLCKLQYMNGTLRAHREGKLALGIAFVRSQAGAMRMGTRRLRRMLTEE